MQDPRSVERLRQGDAATLKRLFRANYSRLYPLAYRLTGDSDTAGAIIRRSFKSLWSERADLDVFDPLDLILLRGTYVEAMAYRSEQGIDASVVYTGTTRDEEESPLEIDKIPVGDRLAYVLFIVDGYSVRELARAFDATPEDLQLSIGRALVALSPISHYSAT